MPLPQIRSRQPLVSVIIPTFNRPHFLAAALGSVAAQDIGEHIEVLVINDAGLSVVPVIRAWSGALMVRLIELDRHVGPARARNVGITLAEGKYISFLDDDDLFTPEHLTLGCGPLERDDADFVYLGAIVADRRLDGLPPDISQFPLKSYPYNFRLLLVANYLHTGSVIVRNFKEAPIRFDESLEVCEDWDLWIALTVALRYRVLFVDKITSIYHQVADVGGMVAGAQLESPSKFEVARHYIFAKWPSDDSVVLNYRKWMKNLERFRSDLILEKRRMPNLLFDDILKYLYDRMSRQELPDHADISRFFT